MYMTQRKMSEASLNKTNAEHEVLTRIDSAADDKCEDEEDDCDQVVSGDLLDKPEIESRSLVSSYGAFGRRQVLPCRRCFSPPPPPPPHQIGLKCTKTNRKYHKIKYSIKK